MPQRRVALVTGGARRVGRAVVQRLAAGGFDVAWTYNSSSADSRSLAAQLRRRGAKGVAIRCDLTSADAPAAVYREFRQTFPRLDLLVNNASSYFPGDLRHAAWKPLQQQWALHVAAPLLLCQAFEKMLRRSRGHVVNMVDLLVVRPMPLYLGHGASKAGLWNLTLALARAMAPQVTVNGIAPGVVEWAPDMSAADRRRYLARVPLARAGTPADVAELVYFLCTTGSYITGQVIPLDGGRSIT